MVKKRNLTTAAPKKGVTNRRQPSRSVKKTRVSKSSATPIEVPTESSVDEEDFVSELSSPESLSSHESPSSNVDGSSLASSEAGETTGIRPLGSSESGGNPGPLESSIGPEQEDPLGIKKVLEKYGVPVMFSDTTSTPGDNVVGNATSSAVQPTSLPSHHVSDSSLLVSSLLNKDNVDPSVPLSREVEESLRQLQTVLAQHKTRAEEAKRQLLEQQQKTANLSMTERALAVEQQTGYVSRPHRDAVPNDLIPFVSPYDQSVSISDYDLWHLAKFAPWHPTLRHRKPAGRHYLLKNVPPGTSPQAIKQFLGDLYDSRAGDTYRFPSTYSWDPRHGIIIEPLVQIFSADGQSVSYEYSAWYLHSLNNKRKLYHNVSVSTEWLPTGHQYSHLPAATRVLDSLSTSPQDVDSVPVQPFSGIGGSQLVLPLASQAMCEKATFAPNLSDLNGLDSVQRFFPGEVYRPEQVDRFTHGLRDGISTQNFEAQFGGEERFISLEEHESVYRKPEGFAKGCDESMSMALSSEQLAQNRKNHVAHMTRSRKTPKRSNSIEISDLTSQSKSPLAELSDVTDSMSEDSSSEDEEPNVLADTPIILSGVPQRKDRTKKKSISKKSRPSCLKSESREDIIKFIHEFSYWAIHVRKQSNRKDFDTRLGIAPINKFDLVRLTLLEIDPTGVSEFIDRQLLSDWKLLNVPGPDSNITEKDLWFRLVLLSQYTSTTQAMGDLKNLRLSQSNDPNLMMRIAEEIFNELIRQGWAVPSTGKFSSPIVLVVYNDHRKPRLTGDFSGPDGINANTRPVKPNLPRICDVLEFLSKANFIGTLDLPKAFWQLNVAEEDVEKTSVSIPGMSISFKRACFGLKNVPAIFQNIMMEIFNVEGVFIYIDDIIVVGNTFEEFISRIYLVLERAERFRVRIGLKKCRFTTSRHPNKILGSNFCNKTRCIDDKRVSALIELPAPSTLPEVRSLLGALNYVREWIPNYSNLTASINELTRGKPKRIAWTKDHDALLDKIKTEIINHMALDLPDTDKNIIISTDASDIAVGGVIWQEENPPAPPGTPLEERRVRPVSFYSRLLNDSQQNWAAIQKELYAILLILTESSLEGFLLSRHLTIFTDHRNLAYLISAPEKNRIVKRWIPIFSEFDFEIEHVAGTNNQWADMLSRVIDRRPVETIKSLLISNHTIKNDIILSHEVLIYDEADYVEMLPCNTNILAIKSLQDLSTYNKLPLFDSWLSTIRAEQHKAINEGDQMFQDSTLCTMSNVYINSKNKILIPSSLRTKVLYTLHGLVQSGHPNKKRSLEILFNSGYFWPSMKADMVKHVKQCPACQKTAPVPKKIIESTGSLWADRPFARLNVDTIGPLPKDQNGNQFLLVFVDSFTRYTILSPLEELNSREVAYRLVWDVIAIFGIPFCIHSDNGTEFANAIFEAICNLLAIEVSRSIPHFSQSNGLVERRHRDVLQSLRRLLVDFNDYNNWSTYIPTVQLQINATNSSVTGHSPYELMFGSDISPGADPSNLLAAVEKSTKNVPFINDIKMKLDRLTKKREEAEVRQSRLKPKKKSGPSQSFNVGDLVLKASKTSKLHGNYTGPYLVVSIDSKSSVSLKNLITGYVSKTSIHQCKIFQSDLPADHVLHRAIASGDSEEHIVVKILDRFNTPDGEHRTVLWFGGDTSSVPTKDIKNTKAYSEFVKLENVDLFCNSRNVAKSKPTKLKRTSSSMSIPKSSSVVKTPVAKRTRSSRREKR
ncbi:hypothetical protein GEMRC1_009759 [Eukaryota sp. GEM-RC1]